MANESSKLRQHYDSMGPPLRIVTKSCQPPSASAKGHSAVSGSQANTQTIKNGRKKLQMRATGNASIKSPLLNFDRKLITPLPEW
ncbi:hypothetical protein BDW59DRAFT_137949 [Aspergillus cavernicola]|uniref:Uncharacterized protein n=1 Tax=Aspergillus cavernicola TaxID=176166 RepID=A0ABR4J373_9EURO